MLKISVRNSRCIFSPTGVFLNTNIPIVDRRIAAKCAWHVAESSKRNSSRISRTGRSVAVVEQVGVKHETVCPRIVGLERPGEVGLARTLKAQSASLQFCVIAIVD